MRMIKRLVGCCLAGMLGLAVGAQAGTVTWGNAGGNWGTGANWVGSNTPGTNDQAYFPSSNAKIPPDLNGGVFGVTNLLINNGGTSDYSIKATGGGRLQLRGANAFTGSAGGVSTNHAALDICRPSVSSTQTWNTGDIVFGQYGAITGTGTVRRATAANYKFFYYRPTSDFRGNLYIDSPNPTGYGPTFTIAFLTNATCTSYFGRTADGSAPGKIILNSRRSFGAEWSTQFCHTLGTFAFVPQSTLTGSDFPVYFANDIVVLGHGGAIELIQNRIGGNCFPQTTFTGRLHLGGLADLADDSINFWYDVKEFAGNRGYGGGNFRLFNSGVVVTQSVPARAMIRYRGNNSGRDAQIRGTISDGAGGYANPLILGCGASNFDLVIQGTNTYQYGTVVDATELGNNTKYRVGVDSYGTLGIGDVVVVAGGKLKLSSTGALASGKKITVQSSPLALGLVTFAFNDATIASLVGASSSGIFGISADVADGSDVANLLGSTVLGNGRMYFGVGGDNATYSGTSLMPGTDGMYRLAGTSAALTMDAASTTTGVLTSTNRVQLGSTAINGNFRINIQDANSFSGKLTVSSPFINPLSTAVHAYGQPSPLTPWGSTGGDVDLQGADVWIRQCVTAAVTTSVQKATVTFSSQNWLRTRVTTVATERHIAFKAASLTRLDRGMLALPFMFNRAQNTERVVVSSGPRPAVVNGIVAPYYTAAYSTDGSAITYSSYDFATYSSATDANGELGFAPRTTYETALPVPGAGTNVVAVLNNVTLNAGSSIYALKVRANAGTQSISGTGSITNTGGGLIATLNNSYTIAVPVRFMSEAVAFIAGGNALTISGKVTADDGLTKGGVNDLTLSANTNAITGQITVNQARLRSAWDCTDSQYAGLGPITNPILLNGGLLSPNSGSYRYLSSSRTITLGPLGGRIDAGTVTDYFIVRSKITGAGALFANSFGLYQAGTGLTGYVLRFDNPLNDYSGGTGITGGTVVVEPTGKLGSGLVVNRSALCLYGNGNLTSPSATYCPMQIDAGGSTYWRTNAPAMGSLSGTGNLVLGDVRFGNNYATTLTVGKDNGSSTWYGIIAEAYSTTPRQAIAGVVKDGTGTWSVFGQQEYRGQTTVTNGTLRLMGSVAGNLNVGPAGALDGSGLVNGNVVVNGGALNVTLSNSMKPLHATGSLSFTPGSTLNVSLAAGFSPGTQVFTVIDGGGSVSGAASLMATGGYIAFANGNDLAVRRPTGTLIIVR